MSKVVPGSKKVGKFISTCSRISPLKAKSFDGLRPHGTVNAQQQRRSVIMKVVTSKVTPIHFTKYIVLPVV